MTTRWEVEAAIWHSDLEPAARLIVLALARKADNDTAVIPPEHTPSLTTLQAMTGLSRSSVTDWLNALEDAGWVKRTRPPKGSRVERTTYVLLVGSPSAQRRNSSPRAGLVRPPDRSSPAAGPDLVRSPDPGSPAAGPAPLSTPLTLPDTSQVEDRPDVEALCQHLAARIEGNGSKRPALSKAWRDAARLMLDRDGRTVEQVMRCIDWSQSDDFWRSNILSMPKLRAKYDQLRLAAQRSAGRAPHRPYRNPDNASGYHGEL